MSLSARPSSTPERSRKPGMLAFAGRFVCAAWLDGMAVWVLVFVAGVSSGPTFMLALWLCAAALKRWLLENACEFFGAARMAAGLKPSLPRELALVGLSLGFLVWVGTLVGFRLPAEPISLSLLIETVYAIFGVAWLALFRGAHTLVSNRPHSRKPKGAGLKGVDLGHHTDARDRGSRDRTDTLETLSGPSGRDKELP